MIYLDNAATSFPKPKEVITAINNALNKPASPGRSGHFAALEASRIIFRTRKSLAKLFGLSSTERIIFTHNITWALNIAILGFGLKKGDHILSGSLEHNSTARPLEKLVKEKNIQWDRVPIDKETGLFVPLEFKKRLKENTKLVVLNHASNVTGALAPAKEIKKLIGNIPLLLDTAQTAGAMPLDDLGSFVDILTFTGHKGLLGPTGTGGLWINPKINLKPLAYGGSGSLSESLEHPDFLPDALEAGTPNTHGIAGLGAGVDFLLQTGLKTIRNHEKQLTEIFLKKIDEIPGLKIWGPKDPNNMVATVAITLQGWSSSDLAAILEQEFNILTRAGLQCSPLSHQEIGSFPGGITRFSFGYFTTLKEVLKAIEALKKISQKKNSGNLK